MSSMCMYQGLGQMLTIPLQHHQGCSETPKCAYVIYGQPLSTVHSASLECHDVSFCTRRFRDDPALHGPGLSDLAARGTDGSAVERGEAGAGRRGVSGTVRTRRQRGVVSSKMSC